MNGVSDNYGINVYKFKGLYYTSIDMTWVAYSFSLDQSGLNNKILSSYIDNSQYNRLTQLIWA
jgi:hypothetical protein